MAEHPQHATNKVGLLPMRFVAGEWQFLIYLPKAKADEEQADMRWGLARGTVRNIAGEDLRSMNALRATPTEQIEDHWQTALQEAKEELGILPHHIIPNSVQDHGLHDFTSRSKGIYPIHFFTLEVSAKYSVNAALNAVDRAFDAADLRWVNRAGLDKMLKAGALKPAYYELINTLETQRGSVQSARTQR